MCLPAEDLDVSRFAQHGQSDAMPPGPLLAEVVHALTGADGGGLAALSDDQLAGIIAAARRLESRAGQACGFAADELDGELDQPEPGVLIWRVPSGRRYTTTPTEYLI